MSICENCVNYVFDDEFQEYCCDAPLDEDEMGKLLNCQNNSCPYFRPDDEYAVVRKQN